MQRYICSLVCLAAACTISATTDTLPSESHRSPRRIESPVSNYSAKKDRLIAQVQEVIEQLAEQLKNGCKQKKDGSYKTKHQKKKHKKNKKKENKRSNIDCRETYHRLLLATGYLQGLQDAH